MKRPRFLLRLMLLLLVLSPTGCAWWRHRQVQVENPGEVGSAGVVATAPAIGAASGTGLAGQVGGADIPAVADAGAARPSLATLSDEQSKAASALAADFYQMHLRMTARGLPDAATMNAYSAFLCPGLSAAFAEARSRQLQFIQAHPDDKPALVEGDLFSSLFEGADQAIPLEVSATENGARVVMALSRGKSGEAGKWQDGLLLEHDGRLWCVADVEYQGKWPSANHGRLSDSLKAQ